MKLHKFKDLLDRGEITDYTPYIDRNKYKQSFREELINRGIYIEESLAHKEERPIIAAIRNGYATDRYEEWSSLNKPIREALAEAGYFPEKFIQDTKSDVRVAVFHKHPKYIDRLLRYKDDYEKVGEIISHQKEPNVDVLRVLLSAPTPQYARALSKTAIRQKYEAMTTEMQPLLATMSLKQLYLADNPLWGKDLTIHLISTIRDITLRMGKETIALFFDDLVNPETYHETMMKIIQLRMRLDAKKLERKTIHV